MKHRFTAPLFAVLVLALAAFTGSALAGGGGGKSSEGSNGNSANAPGQTKPDEAPATAAAASTLHADKQSSARDDKQSSTSATAPASGGSNSQGVKPSNETDHDTYALASSDKTKVYGNGKTAGQIATQAGRGNAVLHGPGNSQPHKAAPCPGGHEVDVHALKHKSSAACASQPAMVTPTVAPTATVSSTVVTRAASAAQGAQAIVTQATAPTATPAAVGAVKGAVATLKPATTKPAGGVLGTTTNLGSSTSSSRLPFTGLPLWVFALVAAGLIGVGLTMRRTAATRS